MDRSLLYWKNAWLLLRIPFSVFLMPVFWFALSTTEHFEPGRAFLVFLIIHLLMYPASNGYNSYCDEDEGSVGGLERPPRVTGHLFVLVTLFDLLAAGTSLFLDPFFGGMVILYLLISKAYSYPGTRLKRFPVSGTAIVIFFQGAFTYWLIKTGLGIAPSALLSGTDITFALTSSLFLLGSYPLTQIYQHQEDLNRGDVTLSALLGVRSTFLFSGIVFLAASGTLVYGFWLTRELWKMIPFLLFGLPVIGYFLFWVRKGLRSPSHVNFHYTMRMNLISSLCLSAAFLAMLLADRF